MITKKVNLMNGREVNRVDVEGKWPTGTWLQQRRAMLKLMEATKVLRVIKFRNGDVIDGN